MNKKEIGNRPKFLVGIGASAGGLEALERMFSPMPEIDHLAFVIVQHLSPDFKSLMDELLGRWTKLPVKRVTDQMPVKSRHIYLLPPKKEMIISDGKLLLTDKDPEQSLTLPIDHFFRSLAHEYGNHSIAIVLSGTGSDGSRGIEKIHSAGGLVLCQDPETSKFDGMPKSAIDTGVVDLTLAPESIGTALETYVENPDVGAIEAATTGQIEVDDSELESLFRMLREECGIDFAAYKISTVSRRIERRVMLNKLKSLDDYVAHVTNNKDELDALYRDLLIGVTQFFRDGEAYETFREQIHSLLMQKNHGDEVRIWVPGCGTGEEAYSICIVAVQELEKLNKNLTIKVFATDVHKNSLNIASLGIYTTESFAAVDREIRDRFFVQVERGFQISQEIRKLVVFAPQNLIKDAPFTKLDVISCRNLLIYLKAPTQIKVISLFHFALSTRGILFLGPSETLGDLSDEFDIIDGHWKIFQKRRDIRLPQELRLPMTNIPETRSTIPTKYVPKTNENLLMGVYDAALSELITCGFLVNEKRELIHTFGNGTAFLTPRAGRPTADLIENVAEELQTSVSTAFHRAMHGKKGVELKGVPCAMNGVPSVAIVKSLPITNKKDRSVSVLILIEISETSEKINTLENIDINSASSEQVMHLETELRYARENLQAMIEELETSNEELQATNEELVAANEELQSTNEELHSVNEELYTVNSEHQKKILELTEVTRDLDNLLLSTDVHTIFLDRDLCIRKFTPKIAESFNFLEQDIGRRVDSFTHKLKDDRLVSRIEEVLRIEQPKKFEVQDKDDTWFLMRILPYKSGKHVDGVVLTLTDITSVKHANMALQESISRRDEFLAMLSHELRNPLGAILNATYILDSDRLSDKERNDAYLVIQRQAMQMGALLNDLLDVSRITQKKIHLVCESVDLRDTIKGAAETVMPSLQEHNQTLKMDIADEPIMVYGNATRLQQIQVNLINNASKYSPDGSQVELSAYADEEFAVIKVKDEGVGIEPYLLDKIFEMFVQSDATIDRAKGGMGVGLTLVKSLVELHKGTITALSDGSGKGSCFVVKLPLTNKAEKGSVPQPHLKQKPGNQIVLIEDNVDASKMLQTLLEFDGYEVYVAFDGISGLNLIEDLHPDLAIVDIGLPEKDGYEIAQYVREHAILNDVYLIALTGYGQSADRHAAIDSGFNEHIVKPVNPQQLSELLGKMLDSQSVR